VIAGGVAIAAAGRLGAPPLVHTDRLIWIAAVGLFGNLVAVALLLPRARGSLNLRGALAHLAGDTLSSVMVLAGGAVMARTGWYALDPILSLGIAVVILFGAWRLLREAVDILLEAVPGGLDPEQIASAIAQVPGVGAVHDLHIWSITSGSSPPVTSRPLPTSC
jgi:cobalt-zinc-cadmium efflux system protein